MCFVDDDDDETATNSESVVSKSHLSELCSEAAKLKSMGVMNQVASVCVLLAAVLRLHEIGSFNCDLIVIISFI